MLSVGIRSPEPYPSLSVAKGEDGEGRGVGKFRQEFYRSPNYTLGTLLFLHKKTIFDTIKIRFVIGDFLLPKS